MANLRVNETPVLVANDGTGAIIVNNGTSTVWLTTDATNKGGFILKSKDEVDQLPDGDLYAYTAKGMATTVYTSDPAIADGLLAIEPSVREIRMQEGSTTQFTIAPIPAHVSVGTLTAEVKNGNVGVVVAGGNIEVEGLTSGMDIITVSNGIVETTVEVIVTRMLASGIVVDNPTDFSMMEIGNSYTVQATVSPAGAPQGASVYIDDHTYQVNGNVVTPSRAGRPATMTVKDADGNEDIVHINAKQSVESVSIINGTSVLWVGTEYKLYARVFPTDASDKTVVWESSDEGILIVDNQGTVSAVAIGTAIITVTTDDGGFEDAIEIEVL